MKWIKIEHNYDSDVRIFPCIVTDGKRVMYIPYDKPGWSLSTAVPYENITYYMKIATLPLDPKTFAENDDWLSR